MLSVTQARQRLLAALPVCGIEKIPLRQAAGHVLAEDVAAPFDMPRFDNSSMDGYAVRAEDVKAAGKDTPVRLGVIGDIPAGIDFNGEVGKGQAARIMTGAAMPAGANAVAPVEDTDASGEAGAALPKSVQINQSLDRGDYVRPAGKDFRKGDDLLKAGIRLRPQEVALIALLGGAGVSVCRKPRVAIFSSGDELVMAGDQLTTGKIYETNSFSLSALISDSGAEPILLGIAGDNPQDVKKHLDLAVESKADLILTSAGVSVGAYDFLREAIATSGKLDFWKVNMRPGKPFTTGRYAEVPYVGLPGNPVSAFVGFEVFVRSALQKMGGVVDWKRKVLQAQTTEDISSDGRESFSAFKLITVKISLEYY